jgi:hypothetical protein
MLPIACHTLSSLRYHYPRRATLYIFGLGWMYRKRDMYYTTNDMHNVCCFHFYISPHSEA